MLASRHRFHGRKNVQALLRSSKRIKIDGLDLRFIIKTNQPTRLAVVVSKKIFKSAVKRNRIRRRLFAMYARSLDKLPSGLQLIIFVRDPELLKVSSETIAKLVENSTIKLESYR
jgi:ribonuclease P protein component